MRRCRASPSPSRTYLTITLWARHGIQPSPLLRKEGEGEVEALIGHHGHGQPTKAGQPKTRDFPSVSPAALESTLAAGLVASRLLNLIRIPGGLHEAVDCRTDKGPPCRAQRRRPQRILRPRGIGAAWTNVERHGRVPQRGFHRPLAVDLDRRAGEDGRYDERYSDHQRAPRR
ncbi:hypothetical protein NITMOv2_2704 [Nitrospira moscoviensis]|uniref:Uncharacterized protein n=1 Tax=Nitrospira moscoviensis TaxID=42253 RepID=A0A0K2GDT0_NITMO|nr:hypothetical protein NITMOv2_2704 [Nitrospira moscoviensis]